MRIRGSWPAPIVLQEGWYKGHARPWNREVDAAHLRVLRANARFIRACVAILEERFAVAGVLSPPLPAGMQTMWREAGFEPQLELQLLRCELDGANNASPKASEEPFEAVGREVLEVDHRAFPPLWRIDAAGLAEAMAATRRTGLLVMRNEQGTAAGFAIVGVDRTIGYLQRLAVDPDQQRGGVGRDLVRSAKSWATRRGARMMMLNTQTDNDPAIHLYRDEGFYLLPEVLEVLGTPQVLH